MDPEINVTILWLHLDMNVLLINKFKNNKLHYVFMSIVEFQKNS